MSAANASIPPALSLLRLRSTQIGIVGLTILLGMFFVDPAHAMRGYFVGWYFCLGIALGSMGIVMLHHLTGGNWGEPLRRPAESAAMTLPLLAIAFVPLAMEMKHVFPWADAALVHHEPKLLHRQPFFNAPMVIMRAFAFLVFWSLLAFRLQRLSQRYDFGGNFTLLQQLRSTSAAGLVVYFLAMSVLSIDLVASREVDWFSSIFGLLSIIGQVVAALCCLLLIAMLLKRNLPPLKVGKINVLHDWGNLLQTTNVLWAYIAFAQFLIIWIGNSQEDSTWFHHRLAGGWNYVGTLLIVGHFSIPFVLLLFAAIKRNITFLAGLAGWILLMRALDVLWQIVPSSPDPARPQALHWLDIVGLLGVGGLWCAGWMALMVRTALIPRPLWSLDHATATTHS